MISRETQLQFNVSNIFNHHTWMTSQNRIKKPPSISGCHRRSHWKQNYLQTIQHLYLQAFFYLIRNQWLDGKIQAGLRLAQETEKLFHVMWLGRKCYYGWSWFKKINHLCYIILNYSIGALWHVELCFNYFCLWEDFLLYCRFMEVNNLIGLFIFGGFC